MHRWLVYWCRRYPCLALTRVPHRIQFRGAMSGEVELRVQRPDEESKRRRTWRDTPLRVGLIGLGAVGEPVARALRDGVTLPQATLAAVLVQRPRDTRPEYLSDAQLLTTDPEAFFNVRWDLCVEAAGQPSIRSHGARALAAGRSLLVTSVGVLTDDELHDELLAHASRTGAQLMLAAGAMPGMDWMSSAALDRVDSVSIEQRKRPEGWRGTPAEDTINLSELTEPTVIFKGPAREAASLYPKNANVSAALALATVGLDHLIVCLIADPGVPGPVQRIQLQGAAGDITIQVRGRPAAGSQRTSAVVPLSVIKGLRNLSSERFVGV